MFVLQVTVEELLFDFTAVVRTAVTFVVGFIVVYLVGRTLAVPVLSRLLTARWISPTAAGAIRKLLHLAVIVVAVVVAATLAGFGILLSATATVVAALTLAVGFATRDLISNLVSGAFIVAERTFNIGDWIEWNDQSGIIDDIGFRATRIRTFDNEIVTVPNAQLATASVTNLVFTNRLRVVYSFEIGYDDLDAARDILIAKARAHPDVLDDPAPIVRLTGFTDAGIEIESQFWLADPDRRTLVRVRSEYAEAVLKRFLAASVDLRPPDAQIISGELGVRPLDDARDETD